MKTETSFIKATEYAFERLRESTEELRGGLVSVITPFYNRADLLLRSIKSVQRQSYQNWELILVNDGSTEDIGEVKRYITQDSRIKLISYERNMGVAHAKNTALDAATGVFIAFLDSDDTWAPAKLEKQLAYMLENNFCASHTGYNRVDAQGKVLQEVVLSELQGDVFERCLYSCNIATPCVIVDRELWGNLRFPPNIDYGEDVCVWLELAWIGKWGYYPEALTSVYVRETSAYSDKRKQQIGYAEILRYVLKKPEWATYQKEIGIMARNFVNMFPEPGNGSSTNVVPRGNFLLRFYKAVKRHGVLGFCGILWKRITLLF
jgi:glycosyltransferase involved in cell wall biosynthesis